jgi:hypothetical protein
MSNAKPMEGADQRSLRIRSRGLRGFGIGIIAGVTAIWALVAAVAGHVFQQPVLLRYWIGSIAILVILGLLLEASFRLNRVAIQEDRLRWRLRRRQRGNRPITDVTGVDRTGTGSVRIRFDDGASVTVGAGWFRREDIDRLVAVLERARADG